MLVRGIKIMSTTDSKGTKAVNNEKMTLIAAIIAIKGIDLIKVSFLEKSAINSDILKKFHQKCKVDLKLVV